MNDGRGQNAQRDSGRCPRGQCSAEHDGAHELQPDEPVGETAERTGQVRRRGGHHRRGDDEENGREDGWPVDVERKVREGCPVGHDDRGDDRCARCAEDRGQHEIERQGEPATHDRDHHEHQRPGDRHPEHRSPQRVEKSRHVGHHIRDGLLDVGEQVRRDAGEQHDQGADDGDDNVGRSTRPRFVLCRCEQLQTAARSRLSGGRRAGRVGGLQTRFEVDCGLIGGHCRSLSTVGWARSATISAMPRERNRVIASRAMT